jgi:hypothetical protein
MIIDDDESNVPVNRRSADDPSVLLIFDFVYQYEGDKFYGDKTHCAKETVLL